MLGDIFFLVGFVSRMHSSLISFPLRHSATCFKILEIIEKLDKDNASHIAIGREQDEIHGSKEEVEKTNKIE